MKYVCFVLFYAGKIFLIKNKQIENCPGSLIYYTTDVYNLQVPMENLFACKTSSVETGCLSNFPCYLSMSLLLHIGFSDWWSSSPHLISTPNCFRLRTFRDCLGIQFFDSRPFSQHSQLSHLWLPTPYCTASLLLRDALPRHWLPAASYPTLTWGSRFP